MTLMTKIGYVSGRSSEGSSPTPSFMDAVRETYNSVYPVTVNRKFPSDLELQIVQAYRKPKSQYKMVLDKTIEGQKILWVHYFNGYFDEKGLILTDKYLIITHPRQIWSEINHTELGRYSLSEIKRVNANPRWFGEDELILTLLLNGDRESEITIPFPKTDIRRVANLIEMVRLIVADLGGGESR